VRVGVVVEPGRVPVDLRARKQLPQPNPLHIRLDDRGPGAPELADLPEVGVVLFPRVQTADAGIGPSPDRSRLEFAERAHHLELLLRVRHRRETADAQDEPFLRGPVELNVDRRVNDAAVHIPPAHGPLARVLRDREAMTVGRDAPPPLDVEVRAMAQPLPGRQTLDLGHVRRPHIEGEEDEHRAGAGVVEAGQPVRAVDEQVVPLADARVPRAGGRVPPERVAESRRVRLTRHVAEVHAIERLVRERSDALARQRRPVVDQIDGVPARPLGGQVRHHQLGAADAVADAVFDVETDLHDRAMVR
jgi:hypothetical protein